MINENGEVMTSSQLSVDHDALANYKELSLPDFLTDKMITDEHLHELNDLSKLDQAIATSSSKDCVWIKHWRSFLENVPDGARYQYLMGALDLSQRHKEKSLSHIESRNLYLRLMQDFEVEALEVWRNTRWNANLGPDDEERMPDFITNKMGAEQDLFEFNDLPKLDKAIAASEDRDCIWYKHWRHNLDAVPEDDRFDHLMCAFTLAELYKGQSLDLVESKRLYFDEVQEREAQKARLKAESQARYEAGKAKAAEMKKAPLLVKIDLFKYILAFISFVLFIDAIGVLN